MLFIVWYITETVWVFSLSLDYMIFCNSQKNKEQEFNLNKFCVISAFFIIFLSYVFSYCKLHEKTVSKKQKIIHEYTTCKGFLQLALWIVIPINDLLKWYVILWFTTYFNSSKRMI